ncbi:MAG: YqgE/AlgH family protein [Nitrospinota bacterium]|nr:YqgE/AlgH family protein [Nitrospinota bacterium]
MNRGLIPWTLLLLVAMLVAGGHNAKAEPITDDKNEPTAGALLGTGCLLVAGGNITLPPFARSVVLLTNYGQDGAVGLIINKPTRYPLSSALPEIKSLLGSGKKLYFGGPVSRNIMAVLLESDEDLERIDGVSRVFGNIYFAVNKKVIHRALKGKGKPARGFAGYAGWAPGQLEGELARGDWAVKTANPDAVFTQFPDTLWNKLHKGGMDGLWTLNVSPAIPVRGYPGSF